MRRAGRTVATTFAAVALVVAALAPVGVGTAAGAAPADTSLTMPRFSPQTANRLETGLLDQVGTASGAKAALGPAGWRSLLSTITRTNRATSAQIAAEFPPTKPVRKTSATVRFAASEAEAFSGVIDGILADGQRYGAYRPETPKGATFTEGSQSETKSTDADGNPVTATTNAQTLKEFSYESAVVGVNVLYEATTVVTAADGSVVSTITTWVHSNFDIMTCPFPDGTVNLLGNADATQTIDGKKSETRLTISAVGTVNDDAYLDHVDWEGTADTEKDHVTTYGAVPANRLGAPTFRDSDAYLAEGTNANLATFQMHLAETTMQLAATMAQERWRNGACVEIRTTDDGRGVTPGATVPFTATVCHRLDGNQLAQDVEPAFSGTKSLSPDRDKRATPLDLTFTAGPEPDDTGTVTLTTVSNRGRAVKTLTFTVVEPGWTLVVPAEAADILTPGGKVCDLAKPWNLELGLADDDVDLRWTYTAIPNPDGRGGTISATLGGSADGGEATGTFSSVPYEVTAPPPGQPPGSVGIRFLGNVDLFTQVSDGLVTGWSNASIAAGAGGGLVLKSDPKVCRSGK